jgi:tetratricopeptide (TPR) repeat protein
MTQRIVIRSLEELGRFSDLFVPAEEAQEVRALVPVLTEPTTEADLDALAEAASRAALELRQLAEADAAARQEAEEALAHYRQLQRNAARLERVAVEAEALADRAANLAEQAFNPNCREKAGEVATAVGVVARTARHRLAALSAELASLSVREDVALLLAEERAREEAARREAEERQRETQLREGIAEAQTLARDQKLDEALRLLGRLRKADPSSPAVASSIGKIRRQQWAVKTGEVEKALREARRVYRKEPRQALALLEPLDLSDLPERLVRQVYGCWLQACRRLKLEGAVHYTPTFGRGAVLVPADGGRLEVVSAISLRRWKPGCRFSSAALKGARPLN